MGMKPRKKPALKLNSCTMEGIKLYSVAIRELLKQCKVPKEEWQTCLDDLEKWPKADADAELQWFLGWFNGVAESLGCNLEDLVIL